MIQFDINRKFALGRNHENYFPLLEGIAEFLSYHIEPYANTFDRKELFSKYIFKSIAERVIPMTFPEEFRGINLPFPVYIAAMEMVYEADASHGLSVSIDVTANNGIFQFGSEAQKNKYLPRLITGEDISAFALTEPDAGSNTSQMKTNARLEKDKWIINGEKSFITNAGYADVYYLIAKTENGLSNFIVEEDKQFFKSHIKKLGVKASPTGILSFNDYEIPKENLVGEDGKGHEYFTSMLFKGRISIGAYALGIANGFYERYKTNAGKTEKEIHAVAKMGVALNSARTFVYSAANMTGDYNLMANYSAQAKLAATNAGYFVCGHEIPLTMTKGDAESCERNIRDIRLSSIGEGTSEILESIVGRYELNQ